MTHVHGTTVPQNSVAAAMSPPRAKAAPVYAVALRNSRGHPLFKTTTRARSPEEAVAQAQAAYADFLVGIGEQRDLREHAAELVPDAAHTLVVRSRAPESCQIPYFVRIAGERREDAAAYRLSRADAVALLREVIEADRAMLEALLAGATIDLCPVHQWSPRTGLVTIDCAFRAPDATGRLRNLRPASPALRMAVRLIVLRQLLRSRETVHQPLGQRWRAASHAVPSATLRALRRAQGTRRPGSLIAWLRDRGHLALAMALALEAGR